MDEATSARIFERIYRQREWGDEESACGPGSSREATSQIRAVLPSLLRAFDVSTMLDAPCGDLNWMNPASLPLDRYIGMDVVPELVQKAREASNGCGAFQVGDITRDPLPAVDLIFCRDCLGHLSHELVQAALRNILASGSRYLMTTTFYAVNQNFPRRTGAWMPVNLELPPYSLPAPILFVPERNDTNRELAFDKSMGLWELSSAAVTRAIEGMDVAEPASGPLAGVTPKS